MNPVRAEQKRAFELPRPAGGQFDQRHDDAVGLLAYSR